ncbi:hypothetical protein MKX78_19565 [Cytobacillus sp. FSL R5-0569]|uniref:hypothetical protein n=1 Tax=Cytobacillus sp. FSL R5-0569 TaxID=2921649 RepID=UPI0030FC0623
MYDVEVLSLYEYRMRMKAYQLSSIDKEYDMHKQAWLNFVVQSTKEQGKKQVPVYTKFKDFFDYDERIKEIKGTQKKRLSKRQKRMAHLAAGVNGRG